MKKQFQEYLQNLHQEGTNTGAQLNAYNVLLKRQEIKNLIAQIAASESKNSNFSKAAEALGFI